MGQIILTDVLKVIDSKLKPTGEPETFKIKFIKKNGEIVFIKRAKAQGVNLNQKKNAMRGVIQIDRYGKMIGHPTPVKIWNIIEFNNMEVKLK